METKPTQDDTQDSELSFLNMYLNYIGDTESPMIYHRWCALSMVGAFLGRDYYYSMGHFEINPNLYVMLVGPPGARKSTAIKISKKIITLAGYDYISAERSSKEKFLLDLAGEEIADVNKILDQAIFSEGSSDYAQMYIACDEFNDFIGNGNVEFISMLGSLWDFTGTYSNRIKTGKSVKINNPTINILGGNTPVNFARAFPPDTLGQGFFSRLLLINGDVTGKRITFPVAPSDEDTATIVQALQYMKTIVRGQAIVGEESLALLDQCYQTYKGIDDVRFESYTQRRFSHLLKLCLVISACYFSNEIKPKHIIEANTILTFTETHMPDALGEFGKSRNSDVTHKIMQVLNNSLGPMSITDIWQHVHTDIEKISELGDILRNLLAANKLMNINGGFLSKRKSVEEVKSNLLNYNYLTPEERRI